MKIVSHTFLTKNYNIEFTGSGLRTYENSHSANKFHQKLKLKKLGFVWKMTYFIRHREMYLKNIYSFNIFKFDSKVKDLLLKLCLSFLWKVKKNFKN